MCKLVSHNEVHRLFSSPTVVRMIRSRNVRRLVITVLKRDTYKEVDQIEVVCKDIA
jgi:hypothetical protein